MDLRNKIVLAHSGYADSRSKDIFKENSVEACKESSEKSYIGIIELDIRKSKDGVLYCYHGTLIQYYLTLKFSRVFSRIKNIYKVDSLAEILDVISEEKAIFLDIKDIHINQEDIARVFNGRRFREVIIGNKSVSYLKGFDSLPNNFVKILNGNILCNFYDLKKLKKSGFKYFEVVFPFQINKKIIKKVKDHGLEFRVSGLFFLNKKSYWKKISAYDISHLSSDFI